MIEKLSYILLASRREKGNRKSQCWHKLYYIYAWISFLNFIFVPLKCMNVYIAIYFELYFIYFLARNWIFWLKSVEAFNVTASHTFRFLWNAIFFILKQKNTQILWPMRREWKKRTFFLFIKNLFMQLIR